MPARSISPAREGRLDITAAAALLGVSRSTLYAWRARDYGPTSVRYAGKLSYRAEDCYRFITESEAATARGNVR